MDQPIKSQKGHVKSAPMALPPVARLMGPIIATPIPDPSIEGSNPMSLPPVGITMTPPPIGIQIPLPSIGTPVSLPPISTPMPLPPIGTQISLPPVSTTITPPPIGDPMPLPPIGTPISLLPIGTPILPSSICAPIPLRPIGTPIIPSAMEVLPPTTDPLAIPTTAEQFYAQHAFYIYTVLRSNILPEPYIARTVHYERMYVQRPPRPPLMPYRRRCTHGNCMWYDLLPVLPGNNMRVEDGAAGNPMEEPRS